MKFFKLFAAVIIVLLLGGCKKIDESRFDNGKNNQVENIISKQIESAETSVIITEAAVQTEFTKKTEAVNSGTLETTEETFKAETEISDTEFSDISSESSTRSDNSKSDTEAQTADSIYEAVDYDLTKMDSDMVYATVFQMINYPDEYIGKTFKIEGNYFTMYSKNTDHYYHYCAVQDALACCAQGLEFVWDDGSHVYPDEYPQDNDLIIVNGTFETYQEEGDDFVYCRLYNAIWKYKFD